MIVARELLIINLIVFSSLFVKLFFISMDLTQDGYEYFILSRNFAETNRIYQDDYVYLHNIGLPLIHGLIFKIIPPLFSTHILLTLVWSSLSLYAGYFFFRKFMSYRYSVLGLILLAFNYRLMENSGLGITEPLFLLFVWSAFCLSASSKRLRIFSIIIGGLSIIIRFEGVVVFGYVIINYVWTYSKLKYSLMSLLIFPITSISKIIEYQTIESDYYPLSINGVNHHINILGTFQTHLFHELRSHAVIFSNNFYLKISNAVIYWGWSLFPEFLFLIPFGMYAIIKKRIGVSLLVWIVVFGSVGVWAYLDAFDTRYFFMSFLFIDLLCLYGVKEIIRAIPSRSHTNQNK